MAPKSILTCRVRDEIGWDGEVGVVVVVECGWINGVSDVLSNVLSVDVSAKDVEAYCGSWWRGCSGMCCIIVVSVVEDVEDENVEVSAGMVTGSLCMATSGMLCITAECTECWKDDAGVLNVPGECVVNVVVSCCCNVGDASWMEDIVDMSRLSRCGEACCCLIGVDVFGVNGNGCVSCFGLVVGVLLELSWFLLELVVVVVVVVSGVVGWVWGEGGNGIVCVVSVVSEMAWVVLGDGSVLWDGGAKDGVMFSSSVSSLFTQ